MTKVPSLDIFKGGRAVMYHLRIPKEPGDPLWSCFGRLLRLLTQFGMEPMVLDSERPVGGDVEATYRRSNKPSWSRDRAQNRDASRSGVDVGRLVERSEVRL